MNKKGGLGKGLGALINQNMVEEENSGVNIIPINLIKPNAQQPRKNFDDEKINNLSESIKEHGIIQPLVLIRDGDNYIIVAGERRWRAAKNLSLKEVPAVIMELSDKELLEVSLIENIQREDLNPIEEALAYKKLLEEFKLTQEQLAIKVGKSRTAITNCIRLLNLDERVQGYLIDEVISEGHARTLLGIEDKNLQYELAQKIIDEKLSVRETERLIKKLQDKHEKKTTEGDNQKIQVYIDDIRDKLEVMFATKVNLKNKNSRGKIEIEYYSNDDLQRILEILKI
ncbi:chromosome partitioning protein, ParB family [Clostridium acidisoli DSM 12555]|uniref:Chromosome partitioning protein, ParB family n=1 Tax=Clostridium acidisoli DSM 12555 TaxID=1121291 RepID=A0A1W1XWR6_9CLOT|nr:ParB/RepB/Spo0J family partition protein [Clostridium acidisoli]SMC28430.1 chromosome partitioning protein, ParB family [Clostridium acidisoli DSM 12555]